LKINLAIQKSGRLTDKTWDLLSACGLDFEKRKDILKLEVKNFPINLILMRDDDIPGAIESGICQIGICGENVLFEKSNHDQLQILSKLGFGKCRLSIASPKEDSYSSVQDLQGKKIASSYPKILSSFLKNNQVDASVIEMSGSVEIAPHLEMADAICDLVSTGQTMKTHGIIEREVILKSQSILFCQNDLDPAALEIAMELVKRIQGVLKAKNLKYIMMNAPKDSLDQISKLIPGMENPSIMTLKDTNNVAIHAVCREEIFWETMEKLKQVGASSILVMPIEKMIE